MSASSARVSPTPRSSTTRTSPASMEAWVERLDDDRVPGQLGTLGAKVSRVEALTAALARIAGAGPRGRRPRGAGGAPVQGRPGQPRRRGVPHAAGRDGPLLRDRRRRGRRGRARDRRPLPAAVRRGRVAGHDVPGALVSAADKLDTICGIFAIGQAPTGSADPFALRRGAIGVLAMILDGTLRITLRAPIEAAARRYAASSLRGRRRRPGSSRRWRRSSRGAWRRCCASAASPTTPSTRCWPWPPTTPATRSRAVRR